MIRASPGGSDSGSIRGLSPRDSSSLRSLAVLRWGARKVLSGILLLGFVVAAGRGLSGSTSEQHDEPQTGAGAAEAKTRTLPSLATGGCDRTGSCSFRLHADVDGDNSDDLITETVTSVPGTAVREVLVRTADAEVTKIELPSTDAFDPPASAVLRAIGAKNLNGEAGDELLAYIGTNANGDQYEFLVWTDGKLDVARDASGQPVRFLDGVSEGRQRGFYCSDNDPRYPFSSSIVFDWFLDFTPDASSGSYGETDVQWEWSGSQLIGGGGAGIFYGRRPGRYIAGAGCVGEDVVYAAER